MLIFKKKRTASNETVSLVIPLDSLKQKFSISLWSNSMSLTRRNLLKGIAVSGALGATAAATGVLSTAQAVVPAKKTGNNQIY